MSNQWFKFYGTEFLADMKISQLSISERMLWVTILCLASSEDKGGHIEFCNEALLKSKMGLLESDNEWRELNGVFKLLKKMKMIELTKTGIFVKNFQKRQESYLTPSEKMFRYRAKKGSKVTNVTKSQVTNVTSNRIEENRIEKKEKEKEKENVSSFFKTNKQNKQDDNTTAGKKKPFYKPTGEQMRFSAGKWWVLPQNGGEWLHAINGERDVVWK